jgi:NarL family two-component system response regulator YdfI
MIRVLVVARSAMVRADLAAIVRGDARLELAGEASPDDARGRIAMLAPDVVLEQCDRRAAPAHADAAVVVLVDDAHTAVADQAAAAHAALDGAGAGLGILPRDATRDEIVAALVAAAAGLIVVAPRTAALAFPPETLTAREREVLSHLSRGATNRTIAARLGISEHTVKFHIGSILAKLGASTRTEAVSIGLRLGLVML